MALDQQSKAGDAPGAAGGGAVPLWVKALLCTLGMQSVASFMDQSMTVIAPLLTKGTGLAPEQIGFISSLSALGVVLFLLFGGPFLARLGPIRMLQIGALTAVCGLIVVSSGFLPLMIPAAVAMGMGYGPTPPAGSHVLARTAPPQHRTLIFSIKQAGAPLGGAVAGVLLAPAAALWGWRVALGISVAVGAIAAFVIAPMRAQLDVERDATRSIAPRHVFSLRTVAGPFRLIGSKPTLLAVTGLGFSFAIVQGCLFSFTVTYLVTDRHMLLESAGVAYASLQLSGVCARIFLGWLADRFGNPAMFLAVQAFLAAATILGLASLPEQAALPTAMLAGAIAGFFAASWNGIYLAEISRHAELGQIAEVTSASTVVVFCGYILGPFLFSSLVTWTGGFHWPYLLIAGQLVLMAALQLLIGWRRRHAAA